MGIFFHFWAKNFLKKMINFSVLCSFLLSCLTLPVHAQSVNFLPSPGSMIGISQPFSMATLRGVKVDVNNSLILDFILDKGDENLGGQDLYDEGRKLIKYFLTALTVPEDDLWVNLSPYEKNRIIPEAFGKTEMGRDLLSQDYILKQLTASLIYPESQLGKEFWKRVYERAQKEFGTTNIPVNTFNKIWIVPDKATIFEKGNTAFIIKNRLKVMIEEDYLSLSKNKIGIRSGAKGMLPNSVDDVSKLSSDIVREIIIPELTREVNEGKNFSNLRQIYNSLLLAAWYRKNVKANILGQVYLDKNKIAGSEIADKTEKQKIYNKYVQAFKKGAYNYIKEDFDIYQKQVIPRKYFSGGMIGKYADFAVVAKIDDATIRSGGRNSGFLDFRANLTATSSDQSQVSNVWDVPEGTKAKSMAELADVFNQVEKLTGWPISSEFRNYWDALYTKYLEVARLKASEKWWLSTLKIDDKKDGSGNFRPSALLTPEQRQEWLGIVPYAEIRKASPNDQAHETAYMLLDGGAGSAFAGLDSLVTEIFPDRRNPIGAKGTDVPFSPKESKSLSPVEIKMLFLIKTVLRKRAEEKKKNVPKEKQEIFYYEPILSPDSYMAYDELYNKTPYDQELFSSMKLLDPNTTEDDGKTYRAIFQKLGIVLDKERNEALVTPNFPALDKVTKNPIVGKTFGSHGSIGVYMANQLVDRNRYKKPASGLPKIVSFSNGDGVNNFLDDVTARWMAANKIPVVMVVTTKTGVDKKGGQIGVEGKVVTDKDGKFLRVDFIDGQVKVRMLERADAKINNQLSAFEKNGLAGGVGEVGQQAFNTNVIGVNEGVLADILQRIFEEILLIDSKGDKQKALEAFNAIIAPDLIAGEKKDGIQIEGPIGTVFINLHNYVESHPTAKKILQEVTGNNKARLLTLVGTSFEERSIFFTPIKNTLDWLLQAYSDYYILDMKSRVLQSAQYDGKTVLLPEIDVDDAYDAFKNVKKAIMAIPGITVEGQRVDITGKKVEIVETKISVLDAQGKSVEKSYFKIMIDGKEVAIDGDKVRMDKFLVQGLYLLKLVGDKKSGVVLFPGAHLEGNVMIQNNTSQTINLYDQKELPRDDSGRLILRNIKIVIDNDESGQPKVTINSFDNAQVAQVKVTLKDPMQDLGGIDFDLSNIDMEILTEGDRGVKFNIDPAMFKKGNFDGLVPLILNVSPIKDVPLFLGINPDKEKLLAKV